MSIRRLVTGYRSDGKGSVLSDGPAPAEITLPPEAGASVVDLWRSEALPLQTTDIPDPTLGEFELMPSGCLFRIIDLEPGDYAPIWHTTATADFIYIASGEATLLHDNGSVTLETGDTIVQRGIHHAWVNQGSTRCRMVNTSIAATLPD